MITLGLTGGIGSGKTTVASLLEVMGIPVYVADDQSKQLTNTSPVIREKLIALFGEEIYTPDGLNRPLLASHIFNSPECLSNVNRIIHPEVNLHFLNWVAHQTTLVCAIESAILFESGFDRLVDYSLMVYAPLELRIERACRRSGASREEIEKRIDNQLSDEVKRKKSSFTIINDDQKAVIPQLLNVIETLLSR